MLRFPTLGTLAVAVLSLASAAEGADLPKTKEPIAPPPPPFSWQGGYIGLYAGAILSEGGLTLVERSPLRGPAFVGGGAIGYNWQWTDRIVIGAEADFGYRGVIQAERIGNTQVYPTSAGVLGTFRARAGYTISPRWLVYATSGLAYGANFISNTFYTFAPPTWGQLSSGPTLRAGWAAGAGFEYAWNDRISLKGEYVYTWLADTGVSYNTNRGVWNANLESAGHVVRGGVNYHFASGPLPVPGLPQ